MSVFRCPITFLINVLSYVLVTDLVHLCVINVACIMQNTLHWVEHVGWGAGLHAARISWKWKPRLSACVVAESTTARGNLHSFMHGCSFWVSCRYRCLFCQLWTLKSDWGIFIFVFLCPTSSASCASCAPTSGASSFSTCFSSMPCCSAPTLSRSTSCSPHPGSTLTAQLLT